MTMEKSDQSIRVVKRYGAVTGKEMFRVKGDPNAWCSTVEAAVSQYHRCKDYWEKYHSSGGKK